MLSVAIELIQVQTFGWPPLCRFLDVPVPDSAFPRVNSTQQFWKLVRGEPR